MGLAPYNHAFGQIITTDAPGITADRGFIANLSWTALQTAAADSAGAVLTEAASATEVVTVLAAAMLAQPPCARNAVVVVAASTAGHVKAAAIRVNGLDLSGAAIYEDFTPTVDTPATLTGTKAFASFTSLVIPAQDGASVTVSLGWGELIGLPYKLAKKRVLVTLNDGVVDTAPTLAISSSVLASNTVDFNGSLDGSVMDMSMIV